MMLKAEDAERLQFGATPNLVPVALIIKKHLKKVSAKNTSNK
jgi:hypothetical protein